MSKKWTLILAVLCAAALCLSVVSLVLACGAGNGTEPEQIKDVQYVLYLGTNDKDSNQPVFSHETAKETLKGILIQRFGGYTIQEANGGWIDGETVYTEYTLVIHLSDTDMEHVHTAADKMISTFRQSSVLIQANRTSTEFYAGNN